MEGAKYFFYLKQAQGREGGGGLKNSMADTCMGQEKIKLGREKNDTTAGVNSIPTSFWQIPSQADASELRM